MRATVIALALLAFWVSAAQAAKRVALVIGNGAYAAEGRLEDPTHDAQAMGKLFTAAGFDKVAVLLDASRSEMSHGLRKFAADADDADVAAVFFAGHGMEIGGENYLLPVDAHITMDRDVKYETIALADVLESLEGATKLKLVLLDACRSNPFANTMKRTNSSRSASRGLAPLGSSFGTNLMIAYAAAPGQLALDGAGENSPFTIALLKNLTAPGTDIRIALGGVRDDVVSATHGEQTPYQTGSIGKALVYLGPPAEAAPSGTPVDPDAPARADFALAERVGSREGWDVFLQKYSSGLYATLARAERDKFPPPKPEPAPSPSPTSAPAAPPPAAEAPTDELARREVAQLRRLGCWVSALESPGVWNEEAKAAVRKFNLRRQARLDITAPSLAAIQRLEQEAGGACTLKVGGAEPPGPKAVKRSPSPSPAAPRSGGCVVFNGANVCP